MDLQKDEDFEKAWQENRHIWESTKNLAKAMFYAGQAKAQSNKKIKLLLCDEHLQKCESPTGIFNSQYPDEEPCLICLAKQYKAQSIPDGFVLASKTPSLKVLGRLFAEHDIDEERAVYIYRDIIDAQDPAND